VAAQKINAGDGVVRNKRPLAYYVGKPSEGVKTDWLMQEYSLDHSSHNNDKVRSVSWFPSYLGFQVLDSVLSLVFVVRLGLHFVQDLSYSTSNKDE